MKSIFFRIIHITDLNRLEDEIERLADPQEKAARMKLLERITDAIADYDCHVRAYAYQQTIQKLVDRGLLFEPVARTPVTAAWDNEFDKRVPPAMKQSKKHYTNQFRWHLFSFELLPAIQGEEACRLFHSAEKDELYLFFDRAEECYQIKNANLLTAKDIEALRESAPWITPICICTIL